MKTKLLIILLFSYTYMHSQPITSGADWTVTNITSNNELNAPNTILYGPDGTLWITERVGKKVVKIDPNTSIPISKTTMLDLTGVVYQSVSQDGLMGMAIHPDLYANINTTKNYVYLVYTYDADPTTGVDSNYRIARYTYNTGTGNLDSGSETVIIDGIEAGSDHNSGKITIGPDLKLYFTIGDHGANRGTRACNEIRAQYLPTSSSDYSDYKGKILRLNLDGTIPDGTDGELANPNLNGIRSHVYTYGHRNAQGIVFGSNGKLYSSEHGDRTDDELNIIYAGKNYGWPLIAGYADDLAYAYFNWSAYPADCGSYDFNNPPGPTIAESTSVSTMPDFEPPIGTYNSTISTTGSDAYLTWPTPAPSSIDIYEAGRIPNWGTSLIIPTLKHGTIYRAKLNAAGDALEDGTFEIFHSSNDRYRDIALDPDGVTIYAITDISGQTTGSPTGTASVPLTNKGVVIKIQFTGDTNWYADADGDGYGDITDVVVASPQPINYVSDNTDCDDTPVSGTSIYPGATETPNDGIDQDCNGLDETSLKIDDFNLDNLLITPNPFNNIITIKLPLNYNNSEFNLKVFDLNGRLVFDKKYSSTNGTINVSDLNKLEQATYLIKIIVKETGYSLIKRLIKY